MIPLPPPEHTWFVNLDRSIERRAHTERQLAKAGLQAQRWRATDGIEVGWDGIREKAKALGFEISKETKLGKASVSVTYIELFNHIYHTTKAEYAFILQDDFLVKPNFKEQYAKIAECIDPDDFHALWLWIFEHPHSTRTRTQHPRLFKIKDSHSAVGIILKRNAIGIILDKFKKQDANMDVMFERILQPFGKCYATIPPLIDASTSNKKEPFESEILITNNNG